MPARPDRPQHAVDCARISVRYLRSAGLSRAKATCVIDLARESLRGRFTVKALRDLDEQAIQDRLMTLKGVSPWTAQMCMIFAMGRPDVCSPGDAGLRRLCDYSMALGRQCRKIAFTALRCHGSRIAQLRVGICGACLTELSRMCRSKRHLVEK